MNRKRKIIGTVALTGILAINQCSFFDCSKNEICAKVEAENTEVYQTNENGMVGKEATITGMKDFTEDMRIARSGAWDWPNAWNASWESSVVDCYGLYAAWDSTNLYIGIEFVNVADTWMDLESGTLPDKGKMQGRPVILALNTGKGNAMSGKNTEDRSGYSWAYQVEFDTRIDNLFMGSANGMGPSQWFIGDKEGNTDYRTYSQSYEETGVKLKVEDGSIASQIWMLQNSVDPEERFDQEKYVDAMTKNHKRKYDTFFTYTIPLESLGIDKRYLETNGIGAMALGAENTSTMDCVPHDPSMLDHALENSTFSDSMSYEREDLDRITVPLAAIGNMKARGEEFVTPTQEPTQKPTVTTTIQPTQTPEITTTPTEDPVSGEITNITNVVFRDPDMKVTKDTKIQLSDLVVTLEFASGEEYDTLNHPELEKYLQIEQMDCGNNRFMVTIKCVLESGRMLTCTRYADINEFASAETEKPAETVEPEETETPGMTEQPKQTGTPSPSAKPTMSASPMVSQTPKVSATPGTSSAQPEATKGAVLGETGPKPTVFNPVAETMTTPGPTQNPAQEKSIKVGDIFLYKNIKYKVIEYDTKNIANVSLIGYNSSASSLTLADQVKYKGKYFKVVKIEKGVFKNAKNLKGSIKLPKHLLSIENSAFEGCSRLTGVDIGSKVKKIGKKAFYGCKNVKKVFFHEKNLKSVGANAFKKLHKKRVLFVSNKYMDYYRKLLRNKI